MLVELLVVIAIIGVLIGLLLPAVQAARESARRASCTNNLKQLGLGLHGHHDVNGRFPAAFKAANTYVGSSDAGHGISWVASVLPFIEQAQLFDQINFAALDNWTGGQTDLNLALARANRPGYLLCPSSEAKDIREADQSGGPVNNPTYTSHYYGIMGVVLNPKSLASTYPMYTPTTSETAPHADRGTQGIFPGPLHSSTGVTPTAAPRSVSSKDVTDGLSKTYLLGEISWAGMGSNSRSETRSYLTGHNQAARYFVRSARNIYYPRPINISKAETAAQAVVPSANAWNHLNWGSNHPGGTHFLMADGSVSFVQESISMDIFMAAGSRNSGEVNWRSHYPSRCWLS